MKKVIDDCLDQASAGAQTGTGFFVGADRLHALRYFAGVVGFPENTGTAPNAQRRRIVVRFMELAREAGLTITEVSAELLRQGGGLTLSDGSPCYGLYGA